MAKIRIKVSYEFETEIPCRLYDDECPSIDEVIGDHFVKNPTINTDKVCLEDIKEVG